MASIFDKMEELDEVAKRLELDPSTLRNRIRKGQIEKKYIKKFGTTWVFDKAYAEKELKNNVGKGDNKLKKPIKKNKVS